MMLLDFGIVPEKKKRKKTWGRNNYWHASVQHRSSILCQSAQINRQLAKERNVGEPIGHFCAWFAPFQGGRATVGKLQI